jgi:DNA-binding NtrC family response regulator
MADVTPFAVAEIPTVLLVEDDLDTADLYATSLSNSGYLVTSAQTDADACRAYDAKHHDVVVTDFGLARSGGARVIEHVSRQSGGRVPVIMVTGHEPSSVPPAIASRVTTILVKPVLPHELEREVKSGLQRARDAQKRAHAVQQKIPELIARSQRLSARSTEIRGLARQALGEATCPKCGGILLPARPPVRSSYEYFESCPVGCGRYFRDPISGRYYRLRHHP